MYDSFKINRLNIWLVEMEIHLDRIPETWKFCIRQHRFAPTCWNGRNPNFDKIVNGCWAMTMLTFIRHLEHKKRNNKFNPRTCRQLFVFPKLKSLFKRKILHKWRDKTIIDGEITQDTRRLFLHASSSRSALGRSVWLGRGSTLKGIKLNES